MGLSWVHWINVVLSAISFVLCFVFQAETLYIRPQTTVTFADDQEKPEAETKERIVVADSALPSSYPAYTYMRSLKLITYHPGVVQKFLAPYKVLRFPGVWLVALWYAGLVGLIITASTVGPQLVAAPPYLWGQDVGLINVGGILGALIGCVSPSTFKAAQPLLTRCFSFTRTRLPTSPRNASQRKTCTASQNQNHVSLPLFPRSSFPQPAP
jgi:hypothetical protein